MTAAPRIPHVPALDGLRGVAVIGVLAFHLGHLQGGFLGVDLFFVLSGYLMTSLLVAEWAETGRIGLGAFWARRARRLLPALFLVLLAVAAYASTEPAGVAVDDLRADALATLGYVANWHSIVGDHGYWDLFAAPSLLAHTWSLAIEEQLYIVWPLVAVLALRVRGRRGLLVTSLVLGVASAAAMVVLHGAGDDTARTYFGTDTRAAAVLVGAALAALSRGETRRSSPAFATRRVIGVVGWVAAVGLGVAWFTVGGTDQGLYEGGFALCSLAGAAVIAAATQPGSAIGRVLSFAPLRHAGLISYGVYLWHWPVFIALDVQTDLTGWPLLVAKLATTLLVSEASYRLVERPIRRGSLRGWPVRVSAPAAATAVVLAVLAGTAVPGGTASVAASPEPSATPPPPPPTFVPAAPETERVLVVGDSGAEFLGEGLERLAPARGVEVRNAGTIACGLLTDSGRFRLDAGGYLHDPEWCGDWPGRWAMEVAAFDPDVALLVIGWPGLGDREIAGAWRHPCDPAFDAHYASAVRRAIAVLAAGGARVLIAESPYLTLPVTQSDHAERVDCLNAIYEREADAAARAAVLPLGEWLCEDSRHCTIETEDGVLLRADGIHFRDAGADVAAAWVLDELR